MQIRLLRSVTKVGCRVAFASGSRYQDAPTEKLNTRVLSSSSSEIGKPKSKNVLSRITPFPEKADEHVHHEVDIEVSFQTRRQDERIEQEG